MRRFVFLGAALLWAAGAISAFAQEPAPAALRTANALRVDGRIDEAMWSRAEAVTGFVQRDPSEGQPATFPTDVRVAFDDSTLYVSVRASDPEPDRLIGYLTRRDVDSQSDWLHVFIDSYHDRRTAYQFSVNPAGVKRDAYWFNDENSDDSWDAVWDVTTTRDATGWRADFRIPYSQLRFSRGGDGRLGFSVMRYIARLNETTTWPLVARSVNGIVSQFGELAGVAVNGRQTKRLELLPYTLAQVKTEPPQSGNPLHQTPDPGASVGLDLRYAVTPALSLTATVNPDFGQVEADPAVVNLGAFETFFNERRPFFIEGSGTYQFSCYDCQLFYSRRIGRQPRGTPALADGEYVLLPSQSTILGAGKLTGRVGQFSVGVLTAATEEETANVASALARRAEVVEPATLYSVSRARREFADQSTLGFMLTTTNRRLRDSVSFLPASAVTGGVDYDWRVGRLFSVNGYWAGSTVRGNANAIAQLQRSNVHSFQRPDAGHVEFDPEATSLNGHSGVVNFGKISGERTRFNFTLGYRSPGFDVNDLGFLQRADAISQNAWVQIRRPRPGRILRDLNVNFNQWSHRNFDGDLINYGGNVNAHGTFTNQWSTGGGVNVYGQALDDRLTRGGPAGYVEGGVNAWQYFNTNDRLPVSFHWNLGMNRNADGSRALDVGPAVQLRPGSAVSAEVGVSWAKNDDEGQWVSAVDNGGQTHYVFGKLRQRTSAMTLRLNYALTPTLSLQMYGQPFVSAGHFISFKELVDGRAPYATRYAPFEYAASPDFKVLSFRTTNVMRWEFKPGSTLFVVWQQAREGFQPTGTFRFGRDYADVFATPSTNTILVKLAYWLNP
jgi:hypothetical protein